MMKTQEQSFLNQTAVSLPLNPATIHAGQLSYPLYKATKTLKEKVKPLPFNSSASRVSTHFSSEASSQIVGYTDVFKQEQQREYEPQKAAFGTSQQRFTLKVGKQPGPTTYSSNAMVSIRQRPIPTIFNKSARKQDAKPISQVGPGSYKIEQEPERQEMRKRIKEKAARIREKYGFDQKQNRSLMGAIPELPNNQQENMKKEDFSTKKDKAEKGTGVDRFFLRQNTQKYLNQMTHNYSNSNLKLSSFQVENTGHNFSPAFIEGRQNPYSSYVQVSCGPGPGWYHRKSQGRLLPAGGAGSVFNSKVLRELFKGKSESKQKLKLSYLI